jgi:hypothetical protein
MFFLRILFLGDAIAETVHTSEEAKRVRYLQSQEVLQGAIGERLTQP